VPGDLVHTRRWAPASLHKIDSLWTRNRRDLPDLPPYVRSRRDPMVVVDHAASLRHTLAVTTPESRKVLDADEGQFVLLDPSGSDLAGGGEVDLPLVSFTPADAMFVTVRTGAHWGPVEVTSVPLDSAPSLGDDWDEVAEVSVRCSTGLVIAELMGEPALPLCTSGGDYRVRISAAGRARGADLDYDELDEVDRAQPVERYLVEAWPSPVAPPVELRSVGDQARPSTASFDVDDDDAAEERDQASREAGARICTDLDHIPAARALSGQRDAVHIDVVLPRAIDRVWTLIANLDITNMSTPPDPAVGNVFRMSTYDTSTDGFVGTGGQIVCQWTELSEPTRVAMTWAWMRTVQPDARLEPLLPHEARFSVVLTDQTVDPEQPRVQISLTHADIPAEWVEDMTLIWTSKIDQWAYQSRPKKKPQR